MILIHLSGLNSLFLSVSTLAVLKTGECKGHKLEEILPYKYALYVVGTNSR